MSEILLEENAIILAALTRFSDLGMEAAIKMINGKESKTEDGISTKILQLLTAYRSKTELDDYQLGAILYELRNLSGEDEFPSINPIVGQQIIYIIGADTGGGGTVEVGANYWNDRGGWDASGGTYPIGGGSGTAGSIRRNDTWSLTVGGILSGNYYEINTIIIAMNDSPGQDGTKWRPF